MHPILGQWALLEKLGEGAMAQVYRARRDDQQGRTPGFGEGSAVAVKWLRPDMRHLRTEFDEERDICSALNHPNLVGYRDAGVTDGRPWYAMEYVPGPDLAALGEKLRARPVAERHARSREVAVQVAGALQHMHERGFIHRDVKPANVLWAGRAVLADFGVACRIADGAEPRFVGSLAWAAPEQVAGRPVDPRADQFGLGLVLYWLLTGARPWGESGRLRSGSSRPPPPSTIDPTVPEDLEAVIVRMIAEHPADRFRDMAAVQAAVGAIGRSDAPILAGRQAYADRIASEIERVSRGESRVVRLLGAPGAGQAWLLRIAASSAARRGLVCVIAEDIGQLRAARQQIAGGETLLVVTEQNEAADSTIALLPLGLGDIRRTVFSVAPNTPELATVSEQLMALTGGQPALVEAVLEACVGGGKLALSPHPEPDVSAFLDPLDLDQLELAQALAALHAPAPGAVVAAVARPGAVAAYDPTEIEGQLSVLASAGLAEGIAGRWRLSADLFRSPLLARVADLEALLGRAAAANRPAEADDHVLREARLWIEAGRAEQAKAALIGALKADPAPGIIHSERGLLLATLLWVLGDSTGAARVWRDVYGESQEPRHRAKAGVGLGVVAFQAGEIERALDHLEAALVDADIAHDARTVALASLDLAEARVLHGEPAHALRAARRARDEARILRDGALEAKACRALGQVLVDLGQAAEAEAVLVDATALGRAAGVEEERMAAQVLRARALLDARPGDPTAAAVALDRVVPWSKSAGKRPDPEAIRPLVQAISARAYAAMGQRAQAAASADSALKLGATAPRAMRLRTGIEVVRVWMALGRTAEATELARDVASEASRGGMKLLAWEADCLASRLAGAPVRRPGDMAIGLSEGERAAFEARFCT